MKVKVEMLVAIVAVFVAATTSATTYEPADRAQTGDYALETTTIWSPAGFPTDGDFLHVVSYSTDKGFYLTNDHSIALGGLYFRTGNTIAQAGNGNVLRFDGRGYNFTMPSYEGGYPSKTPVVWQVYYPDSGTVYALISVERTDASSTSAVVKLSDVVFRQETDENLASKLSFTHGTCNFFDPEGAMADTAYNVRLGKSAVPLELYFSGGAKLRARQLDIVRAMPIHLDNAELYSHDGVKMPGGSLVLTNSAVLCGDSSFQQNGGVVTNFDGTISFYSYSVNTSSRLVQKGGSFVTSHNFYISGNFDIEGGNVTVTNNMEFSASTAALHVSGGSLEVRGGDGIKMSNGGPLIEITGGTVSVGRVRWGDGTSSETATIRQTGGRLVNDTSLYMPGFWMNWKGSIPCKFELLGGVTEAKAIWAMKSVKNGGTERATFIGNGGTARALAATPISTANVPSSLGPAPFIGGMDSATLGNKGLVVDTQTFATSIDQDFDNVDGESGWLIKVGSATLSYSGAYAAASAIVAEGTWQLVDASPSFETALVVTNGATFSLVGAPSAVTLDSLVVTNGVLALDPGDVITVSGAVALEDVRISWSSVPSSPTNFLVVAGAINAETRSAIRRIGFSNVIPDGKHAGYAFVYDGEKTVVTVAVADDEPIGESENTVWTGSGAWTTPGNWDAGTPTDAKRAVFRDAAAGKSVTVAAGDVAGAVRFESGNFSLSGTGPLEIAGEAGAGELAVLSGEQRIVVPISLASQIAVPVATGATLEVSAPMSHGSIRKSGGGMLTLSAANAFDGDSQIGGGTTKATNPNAFGSAQRIVTLTGDTVEFDVGGADIANQMVAAASAPATIPVIVKADSDVTLKSFAVSSGAFAKRGIGKMTVEVAGTDVSLGAGNLDNFGLNSEGGKGVKFPSDGTMPTRADGTNRGMLPSFSVAEGELVVKGTSPGASATITGGLVVGLPTPDSASDPVLTIDGVSVGGSINAFAPACHQGSVTMPHVQPVIRIVNGGSLTVERSHPGYNTVGKNWQMTMAATNGTYKVTTQTYLTRMREWTYKTLDTYVRYRFKDSSFHGAGNIIIEGGIDLDFDNSVFANSSGSIVWVSVPNERSYGTLLFRNGSTAKVSSVSDTASHVRDLTFAFDDAELMWSTTGATKTWPASTSGHVLYEMRGKGVILKPAAGATFTTLAPFGGTGGLVVDGPGTVAFGAGTADFAGTLDVRQGTVDFSANGEAAAFTAVKGSGTVSGATMGAVSFPITLLADGTSSNAVTFADCTFGGTLKVDLGRTEVNPLVEPYPENVLVARYTGTTPPVGKMRLVGTGCKNLRGEFVAAGGEVRMNVVPTGMMVIVR